MSLRRAALTLIGANPYRQSQGKRRALVKIVQFCIASAELLLLFLPIYRRRFSHMRGVDLMVIGAQKAGTTWIDRELRRQGLAVMGRRKESHHFDRGRMWTLRRYLEQFQGQSLDLPVIEVAPDYGPLSRLRIRAVKRLFPDMRLAFIARNPVERLWSGLRMETEFDRDPNAAPMTALEKLDYLQSPRARRYNNYAAQLTNWSDVYGHERILVLPFEHIRTRPHTVLKAILNHAGFESKLGAVSADPEFSGRAALPPDAIATQIERMSAIEIDRIETYFIGKEQTVDWVAVCNNWRNLRLPRAPESSENLLVVCGFSPNDRSTSSGQKLAYRRVLELAQTHAHVHVIAFENRLDRLDESASQWPLNVSVDLIPLRTIDRVLGALLWPRLPSFSVGRRWAGCRVIANKLSDPTFTNFFADFSQGLGAIDPKVTALFRFRQHDVVSALYERRLLSGAAWKRLFFALEAHRSKLWERTVWGKVRSVETLSFDDCELIQKLESTARVFAVAAGSTLEIPERSHENAVPWRIIYWGNMARTENEEAALRLASCLLPRVQERIPGAHLWVVGAHPTKRVRALASKDVHITGFVSDPATLLQTGQLAAVPLSLGSGVKIKVLETLELGLPTIVSPVGGEGIPDHPLLTRVTDDEAMIDAIVGAFQSVPAGYNASEEHLNGSGISQLPEIAIAV